MTTETDTAILPDQAAGVSQEAPLPLPLDEVLEEYTVCEFDHTAESWNKIEPAVVELMSELMEDENLKSDSTPVLGDKDDDSEDIESFPSMREMFFDTETTLILLYEGDDVIGLTFAFPYIKFNPAYKEQANEKTAYIYGTILRENKRGKGLVKHLNQKMDAVLTSKGYTHERRDAKVGYAEKLIAVYGVRVKAGEEENKYGLGMQKHLVIDIRQPASVPELRQ